MTTRSAVLVGVVDDAPCGAAGRRVGRDVGAGAGRPFLGAFEDGHRLLADRTLVVEDGRIAERSDTTTPSKNKTESARTLVESASTTKYGRNTPLRCQYRRWRPRRPCGDTVLMTRPRDSTRRRRSLDAPEVRLRRELPGLSSWNRAAHTAHAGTRTRRTVPVYGRRWNRREANRVVPVRTRRRGVHADHVLVASWFDSDFSPRSASNPNGSRTARSKKSSRTGTVELASTESGRRGALRALTTGRSSVQGTAHGSPLDLVEEPVLDVLQ